MVTSPESGAHFAHTSEKLVDITKAKSRLQVEQFELIKLAYN